MNKDITDPKQCYTNGPSLQVPVSQFAIKQRNKLSRSDSMVSTASFKSTRSKIVSLYFYVSNKFGMHIFLINNEHKTLIHTSYQSV